MALISIERGHIYALYQLLKYQVIPCSEIRSYNPTLFQVLQELAEIGIVEYHYHDDLQYFGITSQAASAFQSFYQTNTLVAAVEKHLEEKSNNVFLSEAELDALNFLITYGETLAGKKARPIMKILEKHGYVCRVKFQGNISAHYFAITEAGIRAFCKHYKVDYEKDGGVATAIEKRLYKRLNVNIE